MACSVGCFRGLCGRDSVSVSVGWIIQSLYTFARDRGSGVAGVVDAHLLMGAVPTRQCQRPGSDFGDDLSFCFEVYSTVFSSSLEGEVAVTS